MGEGFANRVSAAAAARSDAACICAGALQSFVQKGIRWEAAVTESVGSGCGANFLEFASLLARFRSQLERDSPTSAATRKISLHRPERNQPRIGAGSRARGDNPLYNSGQSHALMIGIGNAYHLAVAHGEQEE